METQTEEKDARGMTLIRAIRKRGVELGLDDRQLAEHLGYTQKYFNLLIRGERWIGTVGDEKLKALGQFIDYPLVTVYVMAGILNSKDFTHHATLEGQLEQGYIKLQDHKTLGTFVPEPDIWNATPVESRLLSVILFERLINAELESRARLE